MAEGTPRPAGLESLPPQVEMAIDAIASMRVTASPDQMPVVKAALTSLARPEMPADFVDPGDPMADAKRETFEASNPSVVQFLEHAAKSWGYRLVPNEEGEK